MTRSGLAIDRVGAGPRAYHELEVTARLKDVRFDLRRADDQDVNTWDMFGDFFRTEAGLESDVQPHRF